TRRAPDAAMSSRASVGTATCTEVGHRHQTLIVRQPSSPDSHRLGHDSATRSSSLPDGNAAVLPSLPGAVVDDDQPDPARATTTRYDYSSPTSWCRERPFCTACRV